MKKTLVINFYGGPGCGKSTMAARIFSELKEMGRNVEIATEYAKDLTWQESQKVLENQIYVFGNQHQRIFRLLGKVEAIVTDSPLLLNLVYGESWGDSFKNLVIEEHRKHESVNIYLNRSKIYNPKGRNQSEEQAIEKDYEIRKIVGKEINFDLIVPGNSSSSSLIIDLIKRKLEE